MIDKPLPVTEQPGEKAESKGSEQPKSTDQEPLGTIEGEIAARIALGGNEDIVMRDVAKIAESGDPNKRVETEAPKIEPAIIGEGKAAKKCQLFFRWSTVSDLGNLSRGIHLPNSHLGKDVYGAEDQPGTYFSYLGDETTRSQYVAPVDGEGTMAFNWPAFKPEDQFRHRTDAAKGNPRYAVAMLLRVTDQNFGMFSGKIGEVEKQTDGSADTVHRKTALESFNSPEAFIETQHLPQDGITGLGTDIKVVVFDRESANHDYNFMSLADAQKLYTESPAGTK